MSAVEWLVPDDVAVQLHCNRSFVYREIKRGNLAATRVAGRYLISQADIDRYIKAGYVNARHP